MAILPDLIRPGLRLVICGTAVGERSERRGHYYAGPGNAFYRFLHESNMTDVQLMPEQDQLLLNYGIGLTDLAKNRAQSHDRGLSKHYDVGTLNSVIARFQPVWFAFHGKTAAVQYAKAMGLPWRIDHGQQEWKVGGVRSFVLPNSSGANRDTRPERGYDEEHPTREAWWSELAALAGFARTDSR